LQSAPLPLTASPKICRHGSVVQTTNGSGNLPKNYEYDAFGVEKSPVTTDTNYFRYCGEYYDKETGGYYLRARYYDPTLGRFSQEDSFRDGLNWYVYCGNNPVRFVDPSGAWTIAIGGEGAAAFALRGTAGGQLVYDGTDFGLLLYAGIGGGTPSASLTSTVTVTNAPTITDLNETGFASGGSITAPIGGAVGPNVGGEYNSTGLYSGIIFSIGGGTSLPEAHGEITYTFVIPITEILDFFGLYDDALDVVKNTYSQMSESQKALLRTEYGMEFLE